MCCTTGCRVYGARIGAGAELPGGAAPRTLFGLPEIGMGRIPGAGGTAGLPWRIGRQRTLWVAVTGARIDAATALC